MPVQDKARMGHRYIELFYNNQGSGGAGGGMGRMGEAMGPSGGYGGSSSYSPNNYGGWLSNSKFSDFFLL